MGRQKNKILTAVVFLLIVLSVLSVCNAGENAVGTDVFSGVHFAELEACTEKYIREHFSLNTEVQYELTMDKIYCGDFTQDESKEVFIFCRTYHLPHAAGDGTAIGVLLSADTSEVLLYREFHGDDVDVSYLDGGVFLVTEVTTYQGLSVQRRYLLAYRDGIWESRPVELESGIGENGERIYRALDREGGDEICFLTGKTLIVTSNFNIVEPDDPNRPY